MLLCTYISEFRIRGKTAEVDKLNQDKIEKRPYVIGHRIRTL